MGIRGWRILKRTMDLNCVQIPGASEFAGMRTILTCLAVLAIGCVTPARDPNRPPPQPIPDKFVPYGKAPPAPTLAPAPPAPQTPVVSEEQNRRWERESQNERQRQINVEMQLDQKDWNRWFNIYREIGYTDDEAAIKANRIMGWRR